MSTIKRSMRTNQGRPPGRPSRFSSELAARIARCVDDGLYLDDAAQREGVPRRTLFLWLERGRAGEELYVGFAAAIDEARSRARAQRQEERRYKKAFRFRAYRTGLRFHEDWWKGCFEDL